MTGTSVEIELLGSCKEMKVNRILAEIYYKAMSRIPTPEYTPEELNLAAEISKEAGLSNGENYFGRSRCPLLSALTYRKSVT